MSSPTQEALQKIKAALAGIPGVAIQEYQMTITVNVPAGAPAGQPIPANLSLSIGTVTFTGPSIQVPGTLVFVITDIVVPASIGVAIDGTLKFYKNGNKMLGQTTALSSYVGNNPARAHLSQSLRYEPQSALSVEFIPLVANSGSTTLTDVVLASVIVIDFNYSNLPQWQIQQIAETI